MSSLRSGDRPFFKALDFAVPLVRDDVVFRGELLLEVVFFVDVRRLVLERDAFDFDLLVGVFATIGFLIFFF